MFGLTFEKLLLIAVIAAFLLGPERLPHYAAKLADLVRALRGFTATAKTRLADELGPELTETDWKKLDPRQYDPRRIIRDALTDDPDSPEATYSAPHPPEPLVTTQRPARPIAPGGWQEAMLARVAR